MKALKASVRALSPSPRMRNHSHDRASHTRAARATQKLSKDERRQLLAFTSASATAFESGPDHEALLKLTAALSSVEGLPHQHPDVQDAIADSLDRACVRWPDAAAATRFMRTLGPLFLTLDLSLVTTSRLGPWSDFLTRQLSRPVQELQFPDLLDGEPTFIELVKGLIAQLPAERRSSIEPAICNFALHSCESLRSNTPFTKDLLASQCVTALGCLSNQRLGMSLATGMLRMDADSRSTQMPPPATSRTIVDACARHIIQSAPDLDPNESAVVAFRLLQEIEYSHPALHPPLMLACASALTHAVAATISFDRADRRPELVRNMLDCAMTAGRESIALFQAACQLADRSDKTVAVALHRHVAAMSGKEGVPVPNHELIDLAVMSFYLDSGPHPYLRVHEHGDPTASQEITIAYPSWLVAMREMLSDIWATSGKATQLRQLVAIHLPLNFYYFHQLSPDLRHDTILNLQGRDVENWSELVQECTGPRVQISDWPVLREALHLRLAARVERLQSWMDLTPHRSP